MQLTETDEAESDDAMDSVYFVDADVEKSLSAAPNTNGGTQDEIRETVETSDAIGPVTSSPLRAETDDLRSKSLSLQRNETSIPTLCFTCEEIPKSTVRFDESFVICSKVLRCAIRVRQSATFSPTCPSTTFSSVPFLCIRFLSLLSWA